MKTCNKCGITDSRESFDKKENICIPCKRKRGKEWRENNKEHVLEYSNREEIKKRKKIRDAEPHNKIKRNIYFKKWVLKNRDKKRKHSSDFVKRNPDKIMIGHIKQWRIQTGLPVEGFEDLIETKLIINKIKRHVKAKIKN